MKRFLILVLVFVTVFAVSCDSKKSKKKTAEPEKAETVSQDISAEEGGKVESSDGKTSIEIPGGALESDTTITMTIYNAAAFPSKEGEQVISKVVEFGPDGTVFKKPVIISMVSEEKIENKIITAAIYHKDSGEWSYSEDVAVKFSGYTETGDPIMLAATGDPIMLNATGDPIMLSATGDPIMLAATGDPIMMSATGDPIMMTATGDPIMMTTGHFSSYTFMAVDKKPADDSDSETDDDETTDADNDDNTDTGTEEDDTDTETNDGDTDTDTDTGAPDDDADSEVIIPEPDPVYSKVLCTGQTRCSDGESYIDCPENGASFYGQDAQYVRRKSCVTHKFEKHENIVLEDAVYEQVTDEATGLRWLIPQGGGGTWQQAKDFCEDPEGYGGYQWRLPTIKELMTILHSDTEYPSVREAFFSLTDSSNMYWSDTTNGSSPWLMDFGYGEMLIYEYPSHFACVSGEKYGEINPGNYTDKGDGTVFDSSTNLQWKKTPVSGKTWAAALKHCETMEFAGHSDWRLPDRNELISIVDYSKNDPASSLLPDIASDFFWTSTYAPTYGGAEGAFIVSMADGQLVSSQSKMIETASVLCVRSDTVEVEGIPVCDETGATPCRDVSTGKVWSQVVYADSDEVSYKDVARLCRESLQGGISKWRIPTIDELRTIFGGSDALKTGGSCNVSDECSMMSSEECYKSALCSGDYFESTLHDFNYMISGTLTDNWEEDSETSWMADLREGQLKSHDGSYIYRPTASRCIMDDSITDIAEFPYFDSTNLLNWSSRSKKYLKWTEAAEYCGTLVEGGSDNWRVPTIGELSTLVKTCTEGVCKPDVKGGYSALGELSYLWTTEMDEDGINFVFLDFIDADRKYVPLSEQYYHRDPVRCVRGSSEPVVRTQKEFPFNTYGGGDLGKFWSKKSELIEDCNYEKAMAFCNGLNAESYGGFSDWGLPNFNDVHEILADCDEGMDCMQGFYIGAMDNTLPSGEIHCGCQGETAYTFASHSIFNDFGYMFIGEPADTTGEKYALFNFTTGQVVVSGTGATAYVRCFRSQI